MKRIQKRKATSQTLEVFLSALLTMMGIFYISIGAYWFAQMQFVCLMFLVVIMMKSKIIDLQDGLIDDLMGFNDEMFKTLEEVSKSKGTPVTPEEAGIK